MNPDIMEYYQEAGRIASRVRNETLKAVEAGISLLEVAQYAEDLTRQMGGMVAFPCNISINEVASHYTPLSDKHIFKAIDLVKLDVGVHVNGYIADTAATIEVETQHHCALIETAREALDCAIKEICAGVTTKHIGNVIEHIIRAKGCHPVPALTGHGIGRYAIHNGLNIPNHSSAGYSNTLHTDDVIAIEPFTTMGNGRIHYGETRIVCLTDTKKPSNPIYQKIRSQFNTLPFTSRWLDNPDDLEKLGTSLKKYPVLIEEDGCPVAQAEHTIIVKEDGCDVITA
ncbi:MAG: type II methionyl aminopeptidase [ANME-2 cluster archaeon]|nr:type II methionyl aminopeptidase [ANME-2 cluster archaeon]